MQVTSRATVTFLMESVITIGSEDTRVNRKAMLLILSGTISEVSRAETSLWLLYPVCGIEMFHRRKFLLVIQVRAISSPWHT